MEDELVNIQEETIKIELGIQEIKQEITYHKIKHQNDSDKYKEAISQQPEDTRIMESILQQVKPKTNE